MSQGFFVFFFRVVFAAAGLSTACVATVFCKKNKVFAATMPKYWMAEPITDMAEIEKVRIRCKILCFLLQYRDFLKEKLKGFDHCFCRYGEGFESSNIMILILLH